MSEILIVSIVPNSLVSLVIFDMSVRQQNGVHEYSLSSGTKSALETLLHFARQEIPTAFQVYINNVRFRSIEGEGRISLPCPLKETEAVSALKSVEASAIAALADLRYGYQDRSITIDFERAAVFLFAAYISTVDGMGKGEPKVKSKLPGKLRKDVIGAKSY